jgi:hypothetical protein
VFPLVRYYLLCLNHDWMQAGKIWLRRFFLWIDAAATVGPG